MKGATYSFAKWPWVRAAGGDTLLLRCSIGRHREEHVLQVTDDELVDLALRDLADAVGLVRPVDWHVRRSGAAVSAVPSAMSPGSRPLYGTRSPTSPASRSAERRTTGSASRRASRRPTVPWTSCSVG